MVLVVIFGKKVNMKEILIGIALLWLIPWSIQVSIIIYHLEKTKQIDLKDCKFLW